SFMTAHRDVRRGMGLGVSHRGGPVTVAVVQEILNYFEARLVELGAKEVPGWDNQPGDLVFWRVSGQISKLEVEFLEKQRRGERESPEEDLRHYRNELASANPKAKPEYEKLIRCVMMVRARPKLLIPPDFTPTSQRGIRANLDPRAESLSVVFTQNGSRDEWRDLGDYTKTSHIDPWPGVHVTVCEILQNVQRIVKSAGGDFEISDGCEYCDDYHNDLRLSQRKVA
ncbi:MAG: hypothetical protein JRN42_04170, partial [Nitrososphaerota archaeon]|nr:hypothetical protein [Nitrososphaerota archaeon]